MRINRNVAAERMKPGRACLKQMTAAFKKLGRRLDGGSSSWFFIAVSTEFLFFRHLCATHETERLSVTFLYVQIFKKSPCIEKNRVI